MRVLAAFVCGVYLDLVCAIAWPRDYSNEIFTREMGKDNQNPQPSRALSQIKAKQQASKQNAMQIEK